MANEYDDLLKNDINLEDFILFGSPFITIGIPYYFPEIYYKKTYAGAVACSLGLNSVDWTYKRYVEHLTFLDQDYQIEAKFIEVLHSIKQAVGKQIEYYTSIDKPDIPSLFASSAAYYRLKNTFKAVILCLRTDLYFETLALERMIIEQLAWIFTIHNYQGDFFQVNPTSCISNLKNLIPGIGKVYGQLSERTHIKPNTTKEYIKILENDLGVVLRDRNQTIRNTRALLNIYDLFCIIGEYIIRNYINEYRYVKKDDNGDYVISERRPSIEFQKNQNAKLDEIEKYIREKWK